MIMSYATHRRDFGSFVSTTPGKEEALPRRAGILRRTFDAFMGIPATGRRSTARPLSRGSIGENPQGRSRARNLAAAVDVELERECEPVRREKVSMTGRSDMALPGAILEYHA